MTQQINLYGKRFQPVNDLLPAARMLGLAGAAVLVLGAAWGGTTWKVNEAKAAAATTRETLANRQVEVAALASAVGARRADSKLEGELARTEALHRSRTELMDLLASGALGSPGGFSEKMRARARQSAPGLWLTGFTLEGSQVELRGRALEADLVPAYLRRLAGEKVMSGVAFNGLRIAQPAKDNSASPAAAEPAKGTASGRTPAPTRGPAFVEFLVASDARSVAPEVRK